MKRLWPYSLCFVAFTALSGCKSEAAVGESPNGKVPAAADNTASSQSPSVATTASAEASVREAQKGSAVLSESLAEYVGKVVNGLDAIDAERRASLGQIAEYVETRASDGVPARLTFICTHNSRRSHMGQLWAATVAAYYGISGVETFSGGTEATAFNPRAVAAMKRAGFLIESPAGEGNPRYQVRFGEGGPVMTAFSKKYDDAANPQEGFAAIMTCSAADKACPIVRGAAMRVAIPYEDPKAADDSPQEGERYDERALQIATEMFFVMSQVKSS